nr:hypothetical protein [Microbacterium lemovicicum]
MIRPSGVARPTEDIVFDERRLAVRAGYLGVVTALERSTERLHAARLDLEHALAPYADAASG